MPDFDEVLGRLETDAPFWAELVRDPKLALVGYDLAPDDLSILAELLAADQDALDPLEQRTSKAGLFALFSHARRH